MRYSISVRADRRDQVEAALAKLPSHYETAWVKVEPSKEGTVTVYYTKPVEGTVEVQLPVGRLATLVPEATEEGMAPAYYVLSGEFNGNQLAALKAAMKATKLVKGMTWREVEGEMILGDMQP